MGGEEVGAEEQRLYFQEVWLKRNQKKWESGLKREKVGRNLSMLIRLGQNIYGKGDVGYTIRRLYLWSNFQLLGIWSMAELEVFVLNWRRDLSSLK